VTLLFAQNFEPQPQIIKLLSIQLQLLLFTYLFYPPYFLILHFYSFLHISHAPPEVFLRQTADPVITVAMVVAAKDPAKFPLFSPSPIPQLTRLKIGDFALFWEDADKYRFALNAPADWQEALTSGRPPDHTVHTNNFFQNR